MKETNWELISVWDEKKIGRWSREIFSNIKEQKRKLKHEWAEAYEEMADVLIVKIGIMARGGESVSIKEFCEKHCLNYRKIKSMVNAKMRKNAKRYWGIVNGVHRHVESTEDKMLWLANLNGLSQTENFYKIVEAKERLNIDMRCPCDKDNKDRYCISKKCLDDIERDGHCRCNCFKKRG